MKTIDLHCHSTFSLNDGFGHPKQIVERAIELGWEAAAITEHGHLMSAFPFYKACVENGIKPIIGCEFYIVPDYVLGVNNKDTRKNFHLTVLALSKEGYQNLVAWNTYSMRRENFYYKPRISLEAMAEIAPHPLHHNVVLSGCLGSELCGMLGGENGAGVAAARDYVSAVRFLFSNFFVEIQNHYVEKFAGRNYRAYDDLLKRERHVRRGLIEVARATGTPLVVTNDSHLQSVMQRKAHVAMKASAWRQRDDEHYNKSTEQIIQNYLPDYVYFGNVMRPMERVADGLPDEALENISEIVKEANIRLDPLDNFNYSIPFSGYDDPIARLRRISKDRLRVARQKHGQASVVRFEHELESMGEFAHYLVLMADFIRKAREQGILTNTRGSAANSFLAFCAGIHDVDSIEYGLVFTRFFNPARKKFPDIDIDVEKDRHEDFMQIVYEHMENLEGEGQVVPMCNLGTAANRRAFRLAASALGMPKEQQDEISKLLPQMIDSGMVDDEADAYLAIKDQYPELYHLANTMFDSIKSVGQHACAYLFGTRDRPIEEWVPLYLISSSNSLVTQYDLASLKDFGLVKGDFLRLRTLSVVKRTLGLLGMSPLDLDNLPLDDPATFQLLREGKTEGIFTLQGKENRRGCIECEVETVHDVIASVAIYRPALTRPGLDKVYNLRRTGKENVSYPHHLAEEILSPTNGVPIFQEQVMELGYAVGMDDAEVDEIYEAIKEAKGVGRGAKAAFAKIKPKFLKRARRVMSDSEAEEYWKFIEGSQGYGFNKGHATSYGILAVRAAYLKAHYPAEFFSALLDVYPEKHRYIAAARAEGFNFLGPCVNKSSAGFSLDKKTGGIRVGLARIKGLGPVAVKEILQGQPFRSYDDFKGRTTRRAINATRLEILAELGAFAVLGVPGHATDNFQLAYLGFTIGKPKALKNLRVAHAGKREGTEWHHRGRQRAVELTEARSSVSKAFWIPEGATLELKASAWAQAQSWLLQAVDENGVQFSIIVPEDKEWDVKLVKYLHRHCQGNAICLDGSVRQPFLQDGPMGFRFYNVTGAWKGEPQIWDTTEKVIETVAKAAKAKPRIRRAA